MHQDRPLPHLLFLLTRRFLLLPVLTGVLSAAPQEQAKLFPLGNVTLAKGPFLEAQELNLRYLLAHEVDRFVAPYRREAGLPSKADPYPNWESSGLDGHSAGHFLTALAQHSVVSQSEEAEKRLAYMIAELATCQEAMGTGYLGGIPGGQAIWEDISAGRMQVDNFSLNGKWVPWYNLHKMFAGLRDTWLLTGNEEAKAVLLKMGEWCLGIAASLSDDALQRMLQCEHGGMNEILADLSHLTGDARYLEAARRFSHEALLQPLLAHEDQLDGLHANTQIPKVIGFARIAELDRNPSWAEAANFFWNRLVHARSVAIGGNSVREHFHPADDFGPMIRSREGPESCNTYNMMRLSEILFRLHPTAELADYYERALYNHILSTQHPEHGGYVYFTPMRPRHYRVYSQAESCFWCCVGSGMENHGKYGQFIYAHQNDETLFVNLYIASTLRWPGQNLTLEQATQFPTRQNATLRLRLERERDFVLALRHPFWAAAEGFQVTINGEPCSEVSTPSSYLRLKRTWRDGDRIEISLPMEPRLEPLPDESGYAAIAYGPLVLAARIEDGDTPGLIADDSRMGHVAPGAYLGLDKAPMLVGPSAQIPDAIQPIAGRPLRFSARAVVRPRRYQDLVLEPFSQIHDTRYSVYWRVVPEDAYDSLVSELAASERALMALEGRTLDQVQPGEQQPEVEHKLAADGPLQGVHLGRTWRGAKGWFQYELNTGGRTPEALLVTFYDAERGRHFDIMVNGEFLATVRLTGGDPDTFRDQRFRLTETMREAGRRGPLTVRFVAREESIAGALYGLRLLAPSPED